MRVLIITNFYPPFERGGGEDVAVVSAEGFKKIGHDVSVITMATYRGWKSLWPHREIENGITVYRYYPLNFYFLGDASAHTVFGRLCWTVVDLFNPIAQFQARLAVYRAHPDMIITHNIKGMGLLLPRMLCRLRAVYVHVVHDVQLVEPSGVLYERDELSDSWLRRTYAKCTRWLFAPVSRIIAPSKFLLHFYTTREFFQHAKTYPMLNPVATKRVAPQPHTGVNIVFVGQLERHKGIDTLLKAWQGIGNELHRLRIYGNGSLEAEIVESAKHDASISHMPRKVREEQDEVWRDADIVVVPSLCLENSPTIISEALNQGLVVVASAIGGIPELAERAPRVRLFPTGNVQALRLELLEAIRMVENDPRRVPIPFDDGEAYAKKVFQFLSETGP